MRPSWTNSKLLFPAVRRGFLDCIPATQKGLIVLDEVTVKQKKQEADALRVQASDLALKRDTIYNQRQWGVMRRLLEEENTGWMDGWRGIGIHLLRDLWREQGDVDSQYQQSKTELHKARRNLRDTMPKVGIPLLHSVA